MSAGRMQKKYGNVYDIPYIAQKIKIKIIYDDTVDKRQGALRCVGVVDCHMDFCF